MTIEGAKCSYGQRESSRGVLEFLKQLFDFSWAKNTFPSKKDGKNFFAQKTSKIFFFLIFINNIKKKNFRAHFELFWIFGSAALAGKVDAKSVLLKIF